MEQASITPAMREGTLCGLPDQSDHSTFIIRNDLAAEYVLKVEKIRGYSFKFQKSEVSQ